MRISDWSSDVCSSDLSTRSMEPDTVSPTNRESDHSLRWSGRFSLTRRILAVNILALVLLAGGFFYLDSYRTRVVDARLERTGRELKLLAVSLDRAPRHNWNSLIAAFARQTDDRIRLTARDGTRIAEDRTRTRLNSS